MTTITFSNNPELDLEAVLAAIRVRIPEPRPIDLVADSHTLFKVDLPDASQGEADLVQADLIAQFPAATTSALEPHVLCLLAPGSTAFTWTNMPAALTEFLGLTIHRQGGSLQKIEEVRLVANVIVVGQAGGVLRAQWSTGGAFADFATNGAQIPIDSTGFKRSAWVSIPTAARGDCALRIVGVGGNGVLDPQFGVVLIEGR